MNGFREKILIPVSVVTLTNVDELPYREKPVLNTTSNPVIKGKRMHVPINYTER